MTRSVNHHGVYGFIALAAVGAFAFVIFGLSVGSWPQLVLANLGMVAVGLAASICALVAARGQLPGRGRQSWLLTGLALLSWTLGDMYWSWQELFLEEAPSVPSWADLGYLLLIPFGVTGILIRPIGHPREVNRARLLLDASVMLAVLAAVSWHFVIGPLFEQAESAPLVQALTLAYPLGDLAIAFCSLVLALRDRAARLSTVLLVAGWGTAAVADSTYLVLVANSAYQSGHPIDLFWFAGLVILALAGVTDRPTLSVAATSEGISRPWRFVAPLIFVILAASAIWLAPFTVSRAWPPLEQITVALATVLVVVRVAASYRETVMVHTRHVQRAKECDAARSAREEAARLHGVILTGREIGHLLGNDLAVTLGAIELLRSGVVPSSDVGRTLDEAVGGLERATEHLRQLKRVQRVATKDTPIGPALDLDRSAA